MKRKYIPNARLFVTNEIASHVQLSEKPLQIFLCLLLTFLNDFFVTLLWQFLSSFSSLFVIYSLLWMIFLLQLCACTSLPSHLFCLLLTFLNIFFVMNCKIIEDETITQTYYLWKLMIDWCSLSNRVFLQGKEFTRRNWL